MLGSHSLIGVYIKRQNINIFRSRDQFLEDLIGIF